MDYKNAIKIIKITQISGVAWLNFAVWNAQNRVFKRGKNFEVKKMIESHQEENERQSEVLVDYQH